jgi:hypothetical protein
MRARKAINPVSGEWEDLVGGEGRWLIALRHSTGRLRTLSYLGNELKARRVNRWMREQGHRTVLIDRSPGSPSGKERGE